MSSFMDKVRNGFTMSPNHVMFLFFDGIISKNEYVLLSYIMMMNNFKRHKTSFRQLEKLMHTNRETISINLKTLVEKKLVEVEQCDKFIVIHSNITIERVDIALKTQSDQAKEFEDYDPDIETDRPLNPASEVGSLAPKSRQSLAPKSRHIEIRCKNNIENKDISPNLPVARFEKPVTPQKLVKQAFVDAYRKRYKIDPSVENARSNSIFKKLVNEIGGQDAIGLCYAYLQNNDFGFVKSRHALNLLIANIDKIRVDSIHGRVTTIDQKNLDLDEYNQRVVDTVMRERGLL